VRAGKLDALLGRTAKGAARTLRIARGRRQSGRLLPRRRERNLPEPHDSDEAILTALGRVVRNAAQLDQALRTTFCALLGSKYAAVVAAGQSTKWLIDNCRALTGAHQQLSDGHRRAFLAVLKDSQEVTYRRNRLVHDVIGAGPDGKFTVSSRRHRYDLTIKPVSLEEVMEVERALMNAAVQQGFMVADALGPEMLTMEAQLRWEDYVSSLSPEERAELVERQQRASEE
jgi:hypothetical protein